MARLCTSYFIIFSVIVQHGYCEGHNVTGFVGFYYPDLPNPVIPNRDDDSLRTCQVLSKLSWGNWKRIEPSTCLTLHVFDNCTGEALTDTIPPSVEIKYAWRRPKPYPSCKFHYQDTEFNVLTFSHFTDNQDSHLHRCVNLPLHLEIASVRRPYSNSCVELYEQDDCVGDFYELSESIPNLISVKLNRVVNSYKPCNSKTVVNPVTEADKNEPVVSNENLGQIGLTVNVAGQDSSNLSVMLLFGLLSLLLLLLVSAFLFGVFYFRRKFFPQLFHETPTSPEQQELASFRQSMCQPPAKDIYGPVLQPKRNIDLLA